jgi:hypothetical protein
MSIAQAAQIRAKAAALEISAAQWKAFDAARLSHALSFYVELRSALRREYEDGGLFHLPANELAAQEFLPGHHDRKLYLRLTRELVRLGLVERVRPAGFAAGGRRAAAAFRFRMTTTAAGSNVVVLAQHRRLYPKPPTR